MSGMISPLPEIPTDPIFKLWNEFLKDLNPQKINLGIGIYQDDMGGSYVMPSVQDAAKKIQTKNFDYISMSGDISFLEKIGERIFRNSFKQESTALQQTCGGTQAVQIWGQIMQKSGYTDCIFPTPTWVNHFDLLKPFKKHIFHHIDKKTKQVSLENYKKALTQAPPKSLLVLQGGETHNPCGLNLKKEQLKEIIPLIKEKEISVLIDFAYLGFGDGFDQDAQWIQTLWSELKDVSIALSFSKNACLYRHRLGALLIKTNQKAKAESHMQVLIRESISNPPAFGAEIMQLILSNNFDQWLEELESMKISINQRREKFIKLLPESFQFLRKTKGMFGLLPLTPKQILFLKEKKGIYLLENGRINFSSLQTKDIPYITQCIKESLL